jgi:hypothetical protein
MKPDADSESKREDNFHFMASEALAFAYLMEPLGSCSPKCLSGLADRFAAIGEAPELVVSKAPMAMPVQSRPMGSQNSDEPQVAQKPRRTRSSSWYHLRCSSPRIVTAARGTSVDTK